MYTPVVLAGLKTRFPGLKSGATQNRFPGKVRGYTTRPGRDLCKRPTRDVSKPLDINASCVHLISRDAFRLIVGGLDVGHLVIVCSEFAFIAASDQSVFCSGASPCSSETQEGFTRSNLNAYSEEIPSGASFKGAERKLKRISRARASITMDAPDGTEGDCNGNSRED
jgi:hypothetical protein